MLLLGFFGTSDILSMKSWPFSTEPLPAWTWTLWVQQGTQARGAFHGLWSTVQGIRSSDAATVGPEAVESRTLFILWEVDRKWGTNYGSFENPPACWRVWWMLQVVVVLSVWFCLCLDFPLGADFCLLPIPTLLPHPHPPSPPPPPSSSPLSPSFLTLWWAQLCPRLAPHWLGFRSYRWLFPFLVECPIGLLRHFLSPILDPLVFVPNTFYTHNLSKNSLFQSLSQYGLFQKV